MPNNDPRPFLIRSGGRNQGKTHALMQHMQSLTLTNPNGCGPLPKVAVSKGGVMTQFPISESEGVAILTKDQAARDNAKRAYAKAQNEADEIDLRCRMGLKHMPAHAPEILSTSV